jgi:hypothetical protein
LLLFFGCHPRRGSAVAVAIVLAVAVAVAPHFFAVILNAVKDPEEVHATPTLQIFLTQHCPPLQLQL